MSVQKSASSESPFGILAPAMEYWIDAAQRTVLFWDVMRERGNQYRAHMAETAPNVLDYKAELVVDGRTLERPVNYALVRIVPPPGVKINPKFRPFIVVDPRAGHGPGIGGFKADSEIGVAFKVRYRGKLAGLLREDLELRVLSLDQARVACCFDRKCIIDALTNNVPELVGRDECFAWLLDLNLVVGVSDGHFKVGRGDR